MKLSKFCSIGIIVTLSACFNLEFTGKASAYNKSCQGDNCNNKNPVQYSCDLDGYVVEEAIKTIYRWQDFWQPRQIILKQMYSESCKAKWPQAYIPDGAFLFIREQTPVNGSQPIHGLFKARGTGYFWANGNMSNGYVANQACVALPGGKVFGHDWYERYCTNFN